MSLARGLPLHAIAAGAAGRRQAADRLADAEVLFRYLLAALTIAGLTELLLLRMLSRVGVHIPKEGLMLEVYGQLTRVGSFAFNVATVLAVVTLALAAYLLLRQGRPTPLRLATLGGLLLLLWWSMLLPLADRTPPTEVAFGLTSAMVLLLLSASFCLRAGAPLAQRLAIGLVTTAFLCSTYYATSYALYRLAGWHGSPPSALSALNAGEALALLTGIAALWAWGSPRWLADWRRDPLQIAVPSVLAILLLGSYLAPGSTSAILALWTTGLTLYLPFPLYLVSFWLFALTITGRLRRGDRASAGWALLLLLVAGYSLELTYQHLLAVLAVFVLAHPQLGPQASGSSARL